MKILTWNIAHGRGRSFHQALLTRARLRSNLSRIARVLGREDPHLVALQEVDGPSVWTGRFDHLEVLAREAGFPYRARGVHARWFGLNHGTALMSRLPLESPESIAFDPTFPTPRKGLVVSTLPWPSDPSFRVDVVSVHLDFLRSSTRLGQVRSLVGALRDRPRPRVLMGDFNCQWTGRERTLWTLAHELGLTGYALESRGFATYPSLGRRLDWILVSPELSFRDYRVLPDRLSDHAGVLAVLDRSPAAACRRA